MQYKLEDRNGKSFTVVSDSLDEYRSKQPVGQWIAAGTICCYLGIANPWGMFAETREVKLSLLKA